MYLQVLQVSFKKRNVALNGFLRHIMCDVQNGQRVSVTHPVLTAVLVAKTLSVLVQFAHNHFASTEVKGAQIHGVAKITG